MVQSHAFRRVEQLANCLVNLLSHINLENEVLHKLLQLLHCTSFAVETQVLRCIAAFNCVGEHREIDLHIADCLIKHFFDDFSLQSALRSYILYYTKDRQALESLAESINEFRSDELSEWFENLFSVEDIAM